MQGPAGSWRALVTMHDAYFSINASGGAASSIYVFTNHTEE
jgi:hypothetical protein